MKLEPIIGLEIHVQLKTKSKMFCSCANIFGDVPPNSAICPVCLGYPGTLPVPNGTAIEWTLKAGAALDCKLATKSKFDRKSYFYPDLPKGYQISQYDQPFCGKGELTIDVQGKSRTIGITRIHLEEDAAKNIHDAATNSTLIDFNRAGTPLMEIVTEPDLRTPEEAKLFLQELQRIMRALGVSDANMEQGQLRCDANISLAPRSRREGGIARKLYPKTEIKNLNSFRNVEKALLYEIKRQTDEWEKGSAPQEQSTRGFNADTGKTTQQRSKEEAADYRYFPEPDIPPFVFEKNYLASFKKHLPELPVVRRDRFAQEFGLSAQQATLLTDDATLAQLFEEVVSELTQQEKEQTGVLPEELKSLVKSAGNIIVRQVRELITAHALTRDNFKITPENLAELVVLLQQGKVNKGATEKILQEMQATGGDPDAIIGKLGIEQESGSDVLERYVDEVLAANAEIIAKIKQGKEGAIQFLMGQVMAKSGGKANPGVIIDLIKGKISRS